MAHRVRPAREFLRAMRLRFRVFQRRRRRRNLPAASPARSARRPRAPSASTAMTVSPAPLTSKTVRATDGICSRSPSFPKSDMPCSPRVITTYRHRSRSSKRCAGALRAMHRRRSRCRSWLAASATLGATHVTPAKRSTFCGLGSANTSGHRKGRLDDFARRAILSHSR